MRLQRHPLSATTAILLTISLLLASCGSTTVIRTVPSGAKLYMDQEFVGTTPYDHYDTKIVGSKTNLHFSLEGYEDYYVTLSRNEEVDAGAAVASFFVFPIPLLWIMKYKPVHTYELRPLDAVVAPEERNEPGAGTATNKNVLTEEKLMRLRQLKQMPDVNILTKAEFEAQKQRVLDNSPKALTDANVVKLRQLKQLLDTDVLTTNEYETQKNLIINN